MEINVAAARRDFNEVVKIRGDEGRAMFAAVSSWNIEK